jgi:cardiolipin synthase
MKLLVQPDTGIAPLVRAIRKAKTHVHIAIFRADLKELRQALEAAVAHGVHVHALIADTNRGGEKHLRELEQALLVAGVTVSRTGDDLVRHHGKLIVIDRRTLYTLGFNYTHLDVFKSRSFGIIIRKRHLVDEALKLFEADATRKPYTAGDDAFVVSPENARGVLAAFLKSAKRQVLIYDPKISDGSMIRILQERAKAGVEVRVIGKVSSKAAGLEVAKLPKLRLHVRAILRDNSRLFVGSQSLRPLELDRRREAGVIVSDPSVIKEFRAVFESDWAATGQATKATDVKAGDRRAEAAP